MKMVKHIVQQLAYERRMLQVNHDSFRCEHREIKPRNQLICNLNMFFFFLIHAIELSANNGNRHI
jgi:hypothetical protein